MITKPLSFFSLLLIANMTNTEEVSPKTADIAQVVIKQQKSDFENKLDEFSQAADKCFAELLKAQQECDKNGDCATNTIFLELVAQMNIFEKKIKAIENTMKLNNELKDLKVTNGINHERTIRRIIKS